MSNSCKRPYESLSLTISQIEIEHSIAAGSATVNPVNQNQQVMEQWEEDPTDNRTIVW
ncbi:hypothetical protein [Sphingobacterium chungjuense]|uniref:hypothetical protein n=1 Tax=Sphingobacterium chungjuense TaxID=2675553 RepID=UPI0014094B8F|nr:hypothetical protein [Sphingobacterium chungjuense]